MEGRREGGKKGVEGRKEGRNEGRTDRHKLSFHPLTPVLHAETVVKRACNPFYVLDKSKLKTLYPTHEPFEYLFLYLLLYSGRSTDNVLRALAKQRYFKKSRRYRYTVPGDCLTLLSFFNK